MRLLIVTHGLLTAEFGASQIAINLARALRELGHEVVLWTPQPLPEDTRWWRTLQTMRGKLDEFLEVQDRFDIIECPATLVTRRVSEAAPVIVRNTQPDILYLRYSLQRPTADIRSLVRLPFEYAYTLFHLWLVLQGWRRAQTILCLGTVELRWMQRWFPLWRKKLRSYVTALSASERSEIAKIRHHRSRRSNDGLRFLWIGRWSAHKGPDVLIKFILDWTKARPGDTFTIAGCGPKAERDCPSELLQSSTIRVVSSFKRGQLYTLLAEHDVGLFTSKVEGWGLVLNEMLEAGLLVFATRAGGTEDLQSFFKTLASFPPPLDLKINGTSHEPHEGYDDIFDWAQIARTYTSLIMQGSNY